MGTSHTDKQLTIIEANWEEKRRDGRLLCELFEILLGEPQEDLTDQIEPAMIDPTIKKQEEGGAL